MALQKIIGIVCSSPAFGGLELSTLKLVPLLEQLGWRVRLLLNESSPMYHQAAYYCSDVVSIQQLSDKQKVTHSAIARWLADTSVSVLFTPFNKDIKALSAYKRWRNRKVKLVYQQQMKVGVNKRDLIHRWRYDMLDLWISPLPYLKEETTKRTTVPPHKIAVIPLAVDAEAILNTPVDPYVARERLNLPREAHLLGVLGRIDPKKGQDFAIRSLAHLIQHYNREDHLLIMGNITMNEGNEYHDYLHRLVRDHQLEDRVHFRPYNSDVNLFHQAIDVFVMPSHGETFGMVTVEAMLSGKPVVGVNTDGTAALLEYGRLGWLHELNDVEGFCRQLIDLEHSPSRSEVIEEARKVAMEHYDLKHTAKAIDQALSALLK